jgi:adenylate cyclase
MGHPGQAKLRLAESLTDARKLGHSYSICFALTFYAWVLEYCGDSAECLKIADEAVQVACDEGYTMHHAWARILRGWALSESGAPEEGISQMKEGLEGMRVLGAELIRPEFLSLLAGAEAKSGDPRNALDLVEQGLAIVDATGEHYYDAELFRLKGLFLLALSPDRAGECECLLQRAKTIAVSRESRSFELRAANSLARLYLEWNQPARARGLLAPILGRFKEGEDTRDLNEARELLRLTSRACTT